MNQIHIIAMRSLILALLTGAFFAAEAFAADAGAPVLRRQEVDALPSVKELPDPFLFVDGSRVQSPRDWPRRRAELAQLVQAYQYGHLPPAGAVTATPAPAYEPPTPKESASKPVDPLPPGAREEKLRLTVVAPNGRNVAFHLLLTVPAGQGPFPVAIRGDLCWGRAKNGIPAEVVRRGYILAEFDRTEIVPDRAGPRDLGAYLAYPDGDFSALAAWAWGYHRVIDYLLARGDVDRAKIVVTGHSRGGKATLLAGAMDERIALTVPNNSGCGGAGCYRHQAAKSEDIGAIVSRFPHWFQARFGEFVGKVDRLPIDQHSVKALVAPRGLLSTEALGDLWANPEGSQQSHLAAREVFEFLGAADRAAIHFRPGGHEHNLEDWRVLLDFADHLFFGKAMARPFNDRAFPDAPKVWSWTAPKRQ